MAPIIEESRGKLSGFMRHSWNEIRARAAKFAEDWKDAAYEKGETHSFYNEFFEVFFVRRRSVAIYEDHVEKLDNRSGYIDLFWPGKLIVEQKSAGRNLERAYDQAVEYFDALPEHERPQYILVSDFQSFELHDLDERSKVSFTLTDLPDHVESFGFMQGVQKRTFRDQDPVNVKAAEIMGRLHDALLESGYKGHDLEQFLVRLVFCLFADDTGIFERGRFLDFVETRTSEDGSDTGRALIELFQVLDTPEEARQSTRDEDLLRFPYVNGSLFEGTLRIPAFSGAMRKQLLEACHFDWSKISPAIFGALFQSVMDPVERRQKGAHYTTEKNILKVIEPLFLDELREEFARLKRRKDNRRLAELGRFQEKLGGLTFFDPACGCGNFLIIAYRELRLLEIDVIREIREATGAAGQRVIDTAWQSVVDVDQFYGIEIGEFPARIAESALWMMDHIMNNHLSLEFGESYARIPLEKSPHIVYEDALELDWRNVLPPKDCAFVLGNPPFGGAKYQTAEQREQVRQIAALGKSGGTLDFVCAWFIKAGEYVKDGDAKIGFVATNSITQGEQVAQLWPLLFERCHLEIAFAHRTFAWGSDARGKAHVHVVIVGLDQRKAARKEKRLFSYSDVGGEPEESFHAVLSPYLFDASGLADAHLVVREASQPINGMKRLIIGSKPIDNGEYIFDADERTEFLASEPDAAQWMQPFIGAREYLQGGDRYILALHKASPSSLAALPQVRKRIAAVRAYRQASKSAPTQKLAETPTLYHVNVIPTEPFLVIPEVSSERREYAPIGWLEPPVIPSNKLRLLANATLADFALLTSAMHMAWMRTVTGRLESRYMYSVGVVYNTFPLPPKDADLSKLDSLAQAVLDARAEHRDATLADLYDPDLMPPNLRRAHRNLDRAVDRLYRRGGFNSERERVQHLFMRYEHMQAPLVANQQRKHSR